MLFVSINIFSREVNRKIDRSFINYLKERMEKIIFMHFLCKTMSEEYLSNIEWSEDEETHGTISMDCGFSCEFDKPVEFGGAEGLLNPEDAFSGSLAMCFSITFKSMCDKMRIDIDDFALETKGVLEEEDGKSMISKIYLYPTISSDADADKIEKSIDMAKENCLISNSMKSEVIIEPELN